MQQRLIALIAVAFALTATGASDGAITGLYVETVASNTLTNTTLEGMTYRLYVQFDNPADRFISALDADLHFNTPIYQDSVFGTNLGPHTPLLDPLIANLAADSYVAVNQGIPGADGQWDEAFFADGLGIHGGWWLSPLSGPQNLPDENGRVLVMQLTMLGTGLPDLNGMITINSFDGVFSTFAFDSRILGSIRFAYDPGDGVAGSITGVTVYFWPPAPGTFALFVIAGFVGPRRRRNSS